MTAFLRLNDGILYFCTYQMRQSGPIVMTQPGWLNGGLRAHLHQHLRLNLQFQM